jgi:hypothetical protein
MQLIDCTDYKIVVFGSELTNEEFSTLSRNHKDDVLVYVSLDGCDDEYFPKERSLVKNANASFLNHMMWEGLLDDEEQIDYIKGCAKKFHTTGKQMVIEEYDFQEDEPFYDYSE